MLTLSLSAFGTLFKYANSLLKLTHRRKKLAHRRKNHALQRKAGAENENTMQERRFFLQNTGVYHVYTRLKQGESSAEKLYIAFAHLYADLY